MPPIKILQEKNLDKPIHRIFDEIRETFHTYVVPDPFLTMAQVPTFLELAWIQLKPNIESRYFQEVVNEIQTRAMDGVGREYTLSDHATWLRARGYTPNQIDQIKEILYLDFWIDTQMLLAVTALEQTLEGRHAGGDLSSPRDKVSVKQVSSILPHQILEEEALEEIHLLYEEIKEKMSITYIPMEFRALAVWPDYAEKAWQDLQVILRSESYRIIRGKLDVFVATSVRRLPYAIHASRADLAVIGLNQEQMDLMMVTIREFQRILPGIILCCASLRRALDKTWTNSK